MPEHEARRLLQLVTGLDAAGVALLDGLERDQEVRFEQLVERRLSGEPLQYLEGTVQFGPVELKVDRRVLIPRPETEILWERAVEALREADEQTVIVDLGTGSGALALALKHSFPAARVYATDIDPDALTLARENTESAGVTVLAGDLFDALPSGIRGDIDLLVSNPPYVADEADLPAEVREHEPPTALLAGPQGDEVLVRIAEQAYHWVKPGGWVFLEIAETQARRALALFAEFECAIHRDLTGRPRVLAGHR